MRIAVYFTCLFAFAGVAAAQVSIVTGPAVSPHPRSTFFVGPSYRGSGDSFVVGPRSPNVYAATRSSQVGTFSRGAGTWDHPGVPQSPAEFFRNPYYPNLNFSAPTDIRPQEYVIPPVPRTPLHDPYFEERVYEDFEDAYDYWGW
jgi:hypothetical protein